MDITWTAFPLHPETPLEGRTLAELFAGRDLDIPQMLAHLKKTAAGLGLPLGVLIDWLISRRKSQRLLTELDQVGRDLKSQEALQQEREAAFDLAN